MKLLHHLAFHLPLVVPVCDIHVGFLTLLIGSCGSHAICFGSASYGFEFFLTFSEKVPLKHLIPVNILLNSLCIFIAVLPLVALSVSVFGPATNYSASGLTLFLVHMLPSLLIFGLDISCFVWLLLCDFLPSFVCISQSVTLAVHSLASAVILVPFLALQRNCISNECPCLLLQYGICRFVVYMNYCKHATLFCCL